MTRNEQSDDTAQTETDADFSRRRFLRGTATAGVAAAGVGAATTSASAQWFGGGIQTISVESGFGGWNADGSLPVTDELFVFIHGWFGDTGSSSQASSVQGSLEDGGYTPDEGVVLEWPASNLNFVGAESDTEDVGEVAAGLAEEFYDAGGGNVRLVGHSLGGRCVYWTMTKLSSGYEIESVAGLGTAANGSDICGDPWNPGIDNACIVRNVHSGNDSIVGGAYGFLGNALGADGSGCNPGSNYEDVDVTGSVGSHLGYLGNDEVGRRLASAFNQETCGDGGTGSSGGTGNSGGTGGWWG